MTRSICLAGLAAMVLMLTAASGRADDTGVAQTLHDIRREGKRLCLSSHFHDGSSAGLATRKAAEVEAVRAWAEFTAFEYGTDWAYWARAASKRMSCAQSGATWGCQVEARACK